MISPVDVIRYQCRLSELKRKERKIGKEYRLEVERAQKGGTRGDALGAIHSMYAHLHWEVEDDIRALQTSRLTSLADNYILFIPPMGGEGWERSQANGSFMLTVDAFNALRKAIRQERKERREAVVGWASCIIGIIGAVTGLVAVVMK